MSLDIKASNYSRALDLTTTNDLAFHQDRVIHGQLCRHIRRTDQSIVDLVNLNAKVIKETKGCTHSNCNLQGANGF